MAIVFGFTWVFPRNNLKRI